MPGKGTTRRSIRVDDAIWDAAKRAAEERGENLSDIIRGRLIEYANESRGDK